MPNRPGRKEIPQLARPVQLDLRTKKRMQTIARKLIGSHFAHQTAEAATQQRRPGEMSGLCSVAEWIEQIQMLWANGAESRLELASLISTIRNHLRPRRGDWSSLWESGAIPFSKRKAEKLVVVGFGLGWAINANACSHLPTEWNALYYIARLRRSVQERLIQERVIRQTLSVSQARELFVRFHGGTLKNRSRKTRFRERLRRFEDFFHAELPNCSQAEKNLARARLTGLIQLIDEDVPLPNGGPIFPVSITHIRIEQNANDKNNSSPSLTHTEPQTTNPEENNYENWFLAHSHYHPVFVLRERAGFPDNR